MKTKTFVTEQSAMIKIWNNINENITNNDQIETLCNFLNK